MVKKICRATFKFDFEDVQRCQEVLNRIEFIAKEAEDVCQNHLYVHETDRMRCHKTGEICQRAVRFCESRNGLGSKVCTEKKDLCLSRVRNTIFLRQKLEKMGDDSHLNRVNIEASIGGRGGKWKAESAFHLGSTMYEHGHVVKYFVGAEFALPEKGFEYQFVLESKVKYPKIKTRWNTTQLVEEDLKMEIDGKLSYGQRNHIKEIFLKSTLDKSEEQKREIRESKNFQKCSKQESLSPSCMEVRHEASSVDNFNLELHLPEDVNQQPFKDFLKFYFADQIDVRQVNSSVKSFKEIEANLDLSLSGESAELNVEQLGQKWTIRNIRIPKEFNGILPLGLRKHLVSHLFQKLTHDQVISSCRIEPHTIGTFDQRTFKYQINDCNHLLFKDCSGKVPIAVLARSESGPKSFKIVEIFSGVSHLVIKSKSQNTESGLIIESVVNRKHKKHIELKNSTSAHYEFCHETKEVLFEIRRYSDNVYNFWFRKEMLQVLNQNTLKHLFYFNISSRVQNYLAKLLNPIILIFCLCT